MSETTSRTYDHDGHPWIYVRTEKRTGGRAPEHLFVSAKDGVVMSRWFETWPPDFAPVNDTGGRAEAGAWALIAEAERNKADALTKAMKAAITMVDDRVAEQLRGVYTTAVEGAGVVAV